MAKRMNDDYIECQFFVFHAMDLIPYDGGAPKKWRLAAGADIYLFRCLRCGTKRYDVLSRVTGKLVDRSYDHPDGYSYPVPKGKNRRRTVVKRYINHVNPGGR